MTALALAPMLCATGVIAFLHGHSARTSIESAFARAVAARRAAEQRLALLEAGVVRDALAVTAHEREIMQVREQEQRHLDAADALVQEAKAYAHRRIYLALGTPNASGMTD